MAGNTAAVAGTLDADVSAYPPQTGDFFDVVSAGTARTGTFATVVGNGFTVNYLPKAVRLTPPTLSVANRTVTEGNAGTTVARFRVDLSSPSPGTVTVNYATSNDSATAPADYTATSGTLTFTPGQTSKTFDVPVVGDLLDEANERFNVDAQQPAVRRPGRSERDGDDHRRRPAADDLGQRRHPRVRAAPRTASTSPSRAPAASR